MNFQLKTIFRIMSINIRMFCEVVNGGDCPCKGRLEAINLLGEVEYCEEYKFQSVMNNPDPPQKGISLTHVSL